MASRLSEDNPLSENPVEPFLLKTASIRQKIDTSFIEYQQSLQQRKQSLIDQLDREEAEYKSSREEYKQKRKALDQIKSSVKLQCNTFKSMETTLLAEVENQITQLENEYPEKCIDLVLDTTFTERIQRLGDIELNMVTKETTLSTDETTEAPPRPISPPKIDTSQSEVDERPQLPTAPRDYTQIKEPIMCAVKQGDGPGDLKYPQRVAVDPKTGNIFIADQTSHCVKIFSQQGEYQGSLRHNSSITRLGLAARVELVHPFGVCFYQNSLYVTSVMENNNFSVEFQPCIFKFDRVGKSENNFGYSKSTGLRGFNEGQFNRPKAISADQANGDVYVCDNETRVQVLDKNLTYKRLLSTPGNCKRVIDIQIKSDRIYLLESDGYSLYDCVKQGESRCIKFYNLKSPQVIVPRPNIACLIVNKSKKLFIGWGQFDKESHYISDYDITRINSIDIPSNPADDGHFEIRGIAMDESTERIILVLHSKDKMIQIF